MYQRDFTKGQNQYDLSRSMLQGSLQPIQGANAATSIGKLLTAYFSQKGMNRGDALMDSASNAKDMAKKNETQSLLNAWQGFDPRENAQSGGSMQPEQNREALMSAMMGSDNPQYQTAALSSALSTPKPTKHSKLTDTLMQMGLTPNSPEWNAMAEKIALKSGGVTVNNNNTSVPRPDTGYRNDFDNSGNFVGQSVIPGGPVDVKNQANEQDALAQAEQETKNKVMEDSKTQEVVDEINLAIENNGFFTTGMVGWLGSFIKGSDAHTQETIISTIKGNVALDRLKQAQQASKTGGVFGALSEKELRLLENNIAALEVGMSEEAMDRSLNKIKTNLLKWKGYHEIYNNPEWEDFARFGGWSDEYEGVEIFDASGELIGVYN